MIHKFWNVRLALLDQGPDARPPHDVDATAEERALVRDREEKMEEKVYRIWRVLATFEESSAGCISDMLLHVSNGAYMDGVLVANKFIWHVDILFQALDRLDSRMTIEGMKGKRGSLGGLMSHTISHAFVVGMSYGREAKLLCKKIVAFFGLLSKTQDTGVRKLGVTQELLSLVTGLAHYLKLLIRISLQGALKLERERRDGEGLQHFLDELSDLESVKDAESSMDLNADVDNLAGNESDLCLGCRRPVEDECAKLDDMRWHLECLVCANCARDLSKDLESATWNAVNQRLLCRTCAANTLMPWLASSIPRSFNNMYICFELPLPGS